MGARLAVCLVGCGGIGSRHLRGLAALARTGLSNIDLVAVCDIREDHAQRAASEAAALLGRRPAVHLAMERANADPAIDAFDVVTDAASHMAVALPALRARKAVLCEKPLALTICTAPARATCSPPGSPWDGRRSRTPNIGRSSTRSRPGEPGWHASC